MSIKDKAIALEKTFLPVRDCSLCGAMIGYVVLDRDYNHVGFDTGCDCVNYSNVNESSWPQVDHYYDIQTDKGKKHLDKLWWGE